MIKNRILIVGSNGMLGQRLVKYYSRIPNTEILLCSVEDESVFGEKFDYLKLDISNREEVRKVIYEFYPDSIINAAAYTNVDGCETNKELAWKINVTGVGNLAQFAWTIDAHLVHISSDYVFDGSSGPYSESAKVNPISYYGRTKLASENSILSSGVLGTIIRTNVLYGPAQFGRPDFVKWVVQSLRAEKEIRIVTDQFNNPTYLDDLVFGIAKLSEKRKIGIYNIAGDEVLSRYDFTIRIADFFELDKSLITKIVTEELNQPAPRPLKSGLINLKAKAELGYRPMNIEESLRKMKKELEL